MAALAWGAGSVNAPANIRVGAAWEKYLPAVDVFLPCRSDTERRDRAGLMLLRDMAARDQGRSSWEASQALATIERIAATHAMTEMPSEALTATRLALVKLYTVARDLEKTFAAADNG